MTEPLLSVQEAQAQLLRHFDRLPAENVPLAEAAGRVLSGEVASGVDLPPFPNSSMDGFAVRAADVAAADAARPVELRVVADIPAGQAVEVTLQPGQAARIMTGAVLPAGAEAVVPVEDTDFNYRQPGLPAPASVRILRPARPGENVRPRGQDLHIGDLALPAGRRLRPQDVGLLAMLGVAEVPVHRRPRVAVFSTGDELLPVEAPFAPGKIHDANSYVLSALIEQAGAQPLHLGIVPDQQPAVQAVLDRAAGAQMDLILSSAGVSVGAFDFVRLVVEQHGRLEFWRVNMRPGKPLAFGRYGAIPFIGLPGNPVSAFVGFRIFVQPALMKMAGLASAEQPALRARLLEDVTSDGRESYLRGQIERQAGAWVARLAGHQGSGNLRSLVEANALLVVPAGVKFLPAGSEIDALLLS